MTSIWTGFIPKIDPCDEKYERHVEADSPRDNFDDHSGRFYRFQSFPQVPRKLSQQKAKGDS